MFLPCFFNEPIDLFGFCCPLLCVWDYAVDDVIFGGFFIGYLCFTVYNSTPPLCVASDCGFFFSFCMLFCIVMMEGMEARASHLYGLDVFFFFFFAQLLCDFVWYVVRNAQFSCNSSCFSDSRRGTCG